MHINKITYFIISFFISILTVIATLFTNPDNFYYWLIFVIVILFCPFILYKSCKTIQVTKEQNVLLCQILILGMVMIFARQNIFPQDNSSIIAITQSITKANEIQEFLTTPNERTQLEIIPEENNHPKSYAISVKNFHYNKNYKLTHKLINSNLFDNSVILRPNIKYTKNRIKLLKQLKKECKNILYGIDGITWLEIKIVPPENINDDNAKIKSIIVRYETEENADSKKIKKQVENFINSLFVDSVTDVIIEDLTTNHKAYQLIENAQNEFEKKNYSKAEEFVKEASKLNNNYTKCINTIPQIVEFEQKIKNAPNDYKHYVEIGDLLSSYLFTTSLYGNSEAIKNYEKALEINPNAQGIYEKIAQNYANLSMEYSIIADFSTDKNVREFKEISREKSIEYSLKAIEHSQGNNRIYQTLAYYYYRDKDYNKALEYYNKIDNLDNLSCKTCVSNQKVYSNLKTGHFIQAFKDSKDCSIWFCKLVRLDFKPDEI